MNETIKNNRIIRHLYYYTSSVFKRKQLTAAAKKTLKSFGVTVNAEDEKALVHDMLKMYARYGFSFNEYLYFSFSEKSISERRAFIADWEHLGYACTLNNSENNHLFDNKWHTYNKYKQYYARAVLLCDSGISLEKVHDFMQSNPSFIVKPLDASCGNGVKIIKQTSFELDVKTNLYKDLMQEYNGKFLMEELIKQVPAMAKLHPASINTVRVPTIRMDNETIIFNPFLRIGQKGNCVDNGGAGGIICAVNADTGVVFAAADECGSCYETHPDTNEKIIGFTIPNWEEAKKLVQELAAVTPDNRYTGWDIALTEKGWVMVEGNRRGQFIWQIASQIGSRNELNTILEKLNKKY